MSAAETPFFPEGTKPVRKGVYKTRHRAGDYEFFQHWNGEFWGYYSKSPKKALRERDGHSVCQRPEWCGLAQKPKKAGGK